MIEAELIVSPATVRQRGDMICSVEAGAALARITACWRPGTKAATAPNLKVRPQPPQKVTFRLTREHIHLMRPMSFIFRVWGS